MKGKIPKKAEARIRTELKRFQPIIEQARSRDINESDTVMLISDFIAAVLGWDKYSEITTEFAIRSTYCDLAVKQGDTVHYLIEVKAIGLDLKDNHLRQALDYGANHGVDWVILTNGWDWQVHKILFQKPIDSELVFEFDLLELDTKNSEDLYQLYLLSKEGVTKSAIEDYHEKAQVINKFTIAAILRSEDILKRILRELKRMNKGIRLNPEDLEKMLTAEVLKREVVEGELPDKACKLVKKASNKALRSAPKTKPPNTPKVPPSAPVEVLATPSVSPHRYQGDE